jgi:hypothetical protein
MPVKTRFSDYSERYFYADDKRFVCKELCESGTTCRSFADAHGLKERRVYNWMSLYKKELVDGIHRLHDDCGGRPTTIDETSRADLVRWLRGSRKEQKCKNRAKVVERLMLEADKSAKRSGVANKLTKPSKSSIRRVLMDVNATAAKPQQKTKALKWTR